MRTKYLLVYLIIIVILVLIASFKVKSKGSRVLIVFIGVLVFLGGSKVIFLNTLPKEVSEKVQEVVDTVGSAYIKVDGDKVYVSVEDKWCDVSKISIVGDSDVTINYEGNEIYVGKTGVYNTLRVLQKVGLIS